MIIVNFHDFLLSRIHIIYVKNDIEKKIMMIPKCYMNEKVRRKQPINQKFGDSIFVTKLSNSFFL